MKCEYVLNPEKAPLYAFPSDNLKDLEPSHTGSARDRPEIHGDSRYAAGLARLDPSVHCLS